MALFVGRERELGILEAVWDRKTDRGVVVYGRRRIGKSELLRRFCSTRRSLYFECVQGSLEDTLIGMSYAMEAFDGREFRRYESLQDAVESIKEVCSEARTAVVFDEYPYLLKSYPPSASVLQHLIDFVNRETDSMVVLCGSSMSVMKRETTDYDRPLYGRFGTRMEVGPLPFADCAKLHPNMTDLDMLRLYLTVGGVPKYHLDTETSTYRDYVVRHFLSPTSDMADEAAEIVSAEFTPRDRYIAVVNAISDGKTSLKEISERVGLDRKLCQICLENLIGLGIVDTLHPMLGAPKRPVYTVRDNIVAFCQDVVRKARSFALKDPEDVYDILENDISTFLGRMFEDFCSRYTAYRWACLEIGRWWGRDDDGVSREIDIVATVSEGGVKTTLFGECKFRNRTMPYEVLKSLMEAARATEDRRTARYVLFSSSGFDCDLRDAAEDGDVVLVGLNELVSMREAADTETPKGDGIGTRCGPSDADGRGAARSAVRIRPRKTNEAVIANNAVRWICDSGGGMDVRIPRDMRHGILGRGRGCPGTQGSDGAR